MVNEVINFLLSGRLVNDDQWIFGMFDVHAGFGVIQFVQNRSRATILPIIEEFVLPGNRVGVSSRDGQVLHFAFRKFRILFSDFAHPW